MANHSKSTTWHDDALFGLRWLVLVVITITIFLVQRRPVQPFDWLNDIGVVFGIGAVANLAFWGTSKIPNLRIALPYTLLVGDWLTAGLFVYVSQGDPLLITGIVMLLVPAGLLRLKLMWGSVHALGLFVAAIIGLVLSIGTEPITTSPLGYLPILLLTGGLGLVLGVWSQVLAGRIRSRQRQLKDITNARSQQVTEMREQVRAFSRIANTLSSTLKFEKILDVALDIGSLGLRKRGKQRLVSMVLLFRPDETLYIANARGLARLDDQHSPAGEAGIIAQALQEATPIIGENAWQDPELGQFVAFQDIRSTLAIPLRAGFDNYGLLLFGTDVPNAFNGDQIETLSAIGTQTTVALQNAVLYGSLMAEKERIIELEEDARKALVRDLHDVPTQTISSITMRIRIIQRLLEKNPDTVLDELKQLEEMALRATSEIRHVLFKLRPLALESQGLSAALNQLADKMQDTYGQAVAVRVSSDISRYLDPHRQGVLFFLVEEAVNNARKYAQAEIISVEVARQDGMLVVRIADNGVGFDTSSIENNYDERGSFGMVNMKERAALLDGTLDVQSKPGKGTTIIVSIPAQEPFDESADVVRLPAQATKLERSAIKRSRL